jgi:hypothetical protein
MSTFSLPLVGMHAAEKREKPSLLSHPDITGLGLGGFSLA